MQNNRLGRYNPAHSKRHTLMVGQPDKITVCFTFIRYAWIADQMLSFDGPFMVFMAFVTMRPQFALTLFWQICSNYWGLYSVWHMQGKAYLINHEYGWKFWYRRYALPVTLVISSDGKHSFRSISFSHWASDPPHAFISNQKNMIENKYIKLLVVACCRCCCRCCCCCRKTIDWYRIYFFSHIWNGPINLNP